MTLLFLSVRAAGWYQDLLLYFLSLWLNIFSRIDWKSGWHWSPATGCSERDRIHTSAVSPTELIIITRLFIGWNRPESMCQKLSYFYHLCTYICTRYSMYDATSVCLRLVLKKQTVNPLGIAIPIVVVCMYPSIEEAFIYISHFVMICFVRFSALISWYLYHKYYYSFTYLRSIACKQQHNTRICMMCLPKENNRYRSLDCIVVISYFPISSCMRRPF